MARPKPNSNDNIRANTAFERVKREMDALDARKLMQVNVDAQTATSIVLDALPRLRALRPRLVRKLPTFDLARFDCLEDYALVLSAADMAIQTEVPEDKGTSLRTEAMPSGWSCARRPSSPAPGS